MVNVLASFGLSLLLTATAAAAPSNKPAKPSNDPGPQYCIKFEPATGSNVAKTVCRTKAEWNELGVDVDDLVQK